MLNTSDLTLKEALEYKKLTPLHQGLRDMEKETAMLCAPAAQVHGPHYKPVIQTYGNKTATKGAKMKKNPRFAVGSLLVKEKYESKSAKQPSLITVMKKVYEGSGARTWQYMMIDLSKNKVLSSVDPKKLKDPAANKCISCHDNYSGSDGVSMSFAKG
ncbi:MAG TPA: cytochrome P460 family protein [Fimbriimonas sp.]|nr:cytochrome P460 family protein [Fimbriimonas sp.]